MKETGKKVSTILQLRLHPSIVALKKKIDKSSQSEKFDVDLTYITSRESGIYKVGKGTKINLVELQQILVCIFLICYILYLVHFKITK